MRSIVLVALIAVVVGGCGGKEGDRMKAPEAPFRLSGPGEPVKVLNGQTVKVEIEVTWKERPLGDVNLSASVAPADQGISVTMEPARLEPGKDKAQAVIRCSETAPAGECKVTVTGEAGKAGSATTQFTVRVPQKD
jgi:hypothetical protein